MARSEVRALAAALLLAVCGAAQGRSDLSPWRGVWSGTIGKLPITACLEVNDVRWSGNYYYLKHLMPIRMTGAGGKAALVLKEQNADMADAGPAWSLPLPAGEKISGTWQDGGKSLPIRLSRVEAGSGDELDAACHGAAFNQARELPGKLSTRAALHGKTGYRVITLAMGRHLDSELSSLQLNGSSPAILRVNAALHKALLDEQAAVFECARNAMGRGGEYSARSEPLLLGARWLVVQSAHTSDCGGAHPHYGTVYSTWDLAGGTSVDPWRWFEAAAVNAGSPTPIMQKLLKSAWDRNRDAECQAAVAPDLAYWAPHPEAAGMAFTPSLPHASTACVEPVVIPYSKLLPLMTAAGKTAAASVKADLAP